jgi:hypothetical protein
MSKKSKMRLKGRARVQLVRWALYCFNCFFRQGRREGKEGRVRFDF